MSMSVIACGGGGVNVMQWIAEQSAWADVAGHVSVVGLDTNPLDVQFPFYEVTEPDGTAMNGGGGVRTKVAHAAQHHAATFLSQYPPQEVNVVIHTGGGASGSTIGPTLVSEILRQGKVAIAVVIDTSVNSVHAGESTAKVLAGYTQLATKHHLAVVEFVNRSCFAADEVLVNHQIMTLLSQLYVLTSGQCRRLDATDIQTFFGWSEVVKIKPTMVTLSVHSTLSAEAVKGAVSAIVLTSADSSSSEEMDAALSNVPHVKHGRMPEQSGMPEQLVFALRPQGSPAQQLNAALTAKEDVTKAFSVQADTASQSLGTVLAPLTTTDTGLIL